MSQSPHQSVPVFSNFRSREAAPGAPPPERRAHGRAPLYVEALLSGGLLDARACTIRDSCRGGLFLSVDPGQGELTYTSERRIAAGDDVEVTFFAEQRSHTLRASVVRVTGASLGVALVEPDAEALRALALLAERNRVRGAAHGTPPRDGRHALLDTAASRLERLMNEACGLFGSQAESLMKAAIRQAGSDADQRRLFNIMLQLKERSEPLEQEVLQRTRRALEALRGQLERSAEGAPPARGGQPPADEALALVDKQDFEQFLVGAELVERVESSCRTGLEELEARLSVCFGRPVDRGGNPLSPAVLCTGFSEALQNFTSDLPALRVLHRAMEQVLAPLLADFYTELNQAFEQAGVSVPASPPPRPRPRERGGRAPTGRGDDRAQAEVQGGPGAPGEGGDPDRGPVAGAADRPTARRTANRLFALRRALAGGGASAAAAGLDQPPPDTEPRGGQDAAEALVRLLGALDSTQGGVGAEQDAVELPAAEELLQALRLRLGQSGPVREAEQGLLEALELVRELFGGVLNDPRVVDDVKPLLTRLHTPLQQAVAREPALLEQPEHPARRLLEDLAGVRSLTGVDPGEPLGPRLQEIVARVAAQAAERPGVFEEAAREVEELIAGQAEVYGRNLAQLAAEAERQQAVLRSRRRPAGGPGPADSLARWPEAMRPYLHRAQSAEVGDELEIARGNQRRRARIGWVDEERQRFVLTDTIGHKLTTLGLQEFAMQLRRGNAQLLARSRTPVVEAAMLNSLERLHHGLEQAVEPEQAGRTPAGDATPDAPVNPPSRGEPAAGGTAGQSAGAQASLDAALAAAMDAERLGLALVPVVALAEGAPGHAELAPWLPPGEDCLDADAAALRAAARRLGRAVELDRWVLSQGLAAAKSVEGGWLLLRLSAESLREPGTGDFITELLMNTDVAPGRLCFELGGQPDAEDEEALHGLAQQLRTFGCRFAVGEFGAASGALVRLRELEPDLIRLCSRRTARLDTDESAAEVLLRSSVEIARFLAVPLVAGPVSSETLLGRLREAGVDYAQGPVLGPAQPLAL